MSPGALFIGDVGWDITLRVDHVPAPDEKVHVFEAIESAGGVAANAAVAATIAGATTRALLSFGSDAAGERARQQLASRGVSVAAETVTGPTCLAVILLEPHGEKRLLLAPGVSMYPTREAVDHIDLLGVEWVHTAVYDLAAASRLVARCRQAAVPWSIDLEAATFPDGIEPLADHLRGAAVVFCNAHAAGRIGLHAAGRLLAMGAHAVILSRGADGASWHETGRSVALVRPTPDPSHPVLDTTGAGDCLAGWFIAERLKGIEPAVALRAAVTAATLSCYRAGAQPSFPDRERVAAAIERTLSWTPPEMENEFA